MAPPVTPTSLTPHSPPASTAPPVPTTSIAPRAPPTSSLALDRATASPSPILNSQSESNRSDGRLGADPMGHLSSIVGIHVGDLTSLVSQLHQGIGTGI